MGRESRQARRQRQRRQEARGQTRHVGETPRWAILAGAGVIAAVAVLLGVLAFTQNNKKTATGTTTGIAKTIGGIDCNSNEQSTYHVHGHLEFVVHGTTTPVPPYVGFNIDHDCLYWTHTHSPSLGVIHVEAPRHVIPTLGSFFDIWHQPLSRQRAWKYSVAAGESMRVYVNERPYVGNPRNIKIVQHTDITIEIGSSFVTPTRFNYKAHQL